MRTIRRARAGWGCVLGFLVSWFSVLLSWFRLLVLLFLWRGLAPRVRSFYGFLVFHQVLSSFLVGYHIYVCSMYSTASIHLHRVSSLLETTASSLSWRFLSHLLPRHVSSLLETISFSSIADNSISFVFTISTKLQKMYSTVQQSDTLTRPS